MWEHRQIDFPTVDAHPKISFNAEKLGVFEKSVDEKI